MALTRRRQLAELGNRIAIRVRRLISLFNRSMPLVVRMRIPGLKRNHLRTGRHKVQALLRVLQVLGMLTLVHFQAGHLAAWVANKQLTRKLCRTAAQFKNHPVLVQIHQ